MAVLKSSTCCGQGSSACACGKLRFSLHYPLSVRTCANNSTAQKATCSCGKQSALHCSCDKKATENEITGPRCSCRARPAGECTCDRSSTENASVSGATCSCGSRPAEACTCEKASDGGFNPSNEIDFTTSK